MKTFLLLGVLIVYIFSGARITQALSQDWVGSPWRIWMLRQINARVGREKKPWPAWVAEGPGCPWCVGFWVAVLDFPMVAGVMWTVGAGMIWPAYLYFALAGPWAAAWFVSYLASRE